MSAQMYKGGQGMKRIVVIAVLLMIAAAAFAQKTVTGRVTDEAEAPLVNAAVMLPGSDKGTITDADGKYSIEVPAGYDFLEFSYMGYVTQTLRIRNRKVIDVQLAEQMNSLDEVISVGYISTRKGDVAGAIQNISLADMGMRVLTSADLMLAGKVAGLSLTQNSGQPGSSDVDISIRGISSIENNGAPLVIIDGVEDDISRVNPRDIKSISILKDASSAAIYGNRAAAGVIVIETKEGRRGVEISYTGAATVHTATALPEIVNDPVTYIDIVNEAWFNAANGNLAAPKISATEREKWVAQEDETHQPVDWKELFYKPAFMHTHHVSASGAGERYNFSFSTGYQDQTGVVYSTRADKLDYRLKLALNFFDKKLSIGANVSGVEKTSHEAQSTSSIINRYLSNRPIIIYKGVDEDGTTVYGQGATAYAVEENGGGNDVAYSDLNSSFNLTWTPSTKFILKAVYNIRNTRTHTLRFTPQYELTGSVNAISRTVNRSEMSDRSDWTRFDQFNVTANYKDRIGKKFRFNLLAGYEMRYRRSEYSEVHVYDMMKNEPVLSFGDPNTLSTKSSKSEYAALSGFARANFDYDSRYILELNARYDGSSRFAPGIRFGFFPSAAVAWRVNREKWMRKVKWIDNLKLRASYGRLGNDNVSNSYAYADRMSASAYYSFGGTMVNGIAYSMFADPFTTWEKVDQTNVGFDFDFLNQFSLSVDLFDKKVSDMLCALKPLPSLGTLQNGAALNVGSMLNRGFEVSLAWRKTIGRVWVGVGGNVGYVHNTVMDLGDVEEQWHDTAGNIRSVVGYPTRSRFGYRCIGLYQVEDFTWQNGSDPSIPHMERVYELKPGVTTTSLHQSPRPGDLLLEDQDGNNNITPNDQVYLGRAKSDLTYSFDVSLSWKGLDFQMLFTGQGNGLAYLQYYAPYSTSFLGQVFTDIMDHRWTEETPQYRSLFADKERAAIVSTYNMYDAAYLRLKNVQIGYTFSGAWMDRMRIKNLRVFISGENLLTFSRFPKGFDPERSVTNSTVTSYPILKGGSVGLTLSF